MKHKILIIEDDKMITELFDEAFKKAGLDIDILDLGEKAIRWLQQIRSGKNEKPELVLLDLVLPDMNGLEILKEIRKYPETKDIKVYALTNYSSPKSNEALNAEGINKILIKTQHEIGDLIKLVKDGIEQKN